MWWSDYLSSGLRMEGPVAAICIFRVLFATSCLVKYSLQWSQGYWSLLAPCGYIYYLANHRYTIFIPKLALYRVLFVMKVIAAFSLLSGFAVSAALLILILEFIFEIRIYFKFHTCFFLLLALCLFFSPDAAERLTALGWIRSGMTATTYITTELKSRGDLFASFLGGFTLTVMYVATAFRKLNPDFLSGRTIYGTLLVTYLSRGQRMHRDGWYPMFFLRKFVLDCEQKLERRWKPFTHFTIVCEIALPLFLLYPPTNVLAIVLGLLVHLAFTLLYPQILAHFSLGTLACYFLLLDPNLVAELLT